jgi:hypothetical protein
MFSLVTTQHTELRDIHRFARVQVSIDIYPVTIETRLQHVLCRSVGPTKNTVRHLDSAQRASPKESFTIALLSGFIRVIDSHEQLLLFRTVYIS